MAQALQLTKLFLGFNHLQKIYGDPGLNAIYGAGCTFEPKLFFVFMNPTSRNISSNPNWNGLRAPWLGTKHVWKIFSELRLIKGNTYKKIMNLKTQDWTENIALKLYQELSDNRVYITNFAKCTMSDARPLTNNVFDNYHKLLHSEIMEIKPMNIVTFGTLVSSKLLGKNITMSQQNGVKHNVKINKRRINIYPVYYPVGQGMRNLDLAIKTVNNLL